MNYLNLLWFLPVIIICLITFWAIVIDPIISVIKKKYNQETINENEISHLIVVIVLLSFSLSIIGIIQIQH